MRGKPLVEGEIRIGPGAFREILQPIRFRLGTELPRVVERRVVAPLVAGHAAVRDAVGVHHIAAEAVPRVRPQVERLVGRVRERERALLVVVLDLQVRGRIVEDQGDVVPVRRLERGGVGDFRNGILNRVEHVRADVPRRRVRRVRVVLLRDEMERELPADGVRGHLVVVAPRVVAHKRHARRDLVRHHLARPRRLVRIGQLADQLHPLHVALALADAHEVVRSARRHPLRRRVRRPVRDGGDLLRPTCAITNLMPIIKSIILNAIIWRINICCKIIF